MIRVVMFDFDRTLVDASDRPLPHVAEALDTIRQLAAAPGKPLAIAVLGDRHGARDDEARTGFLARLDRSGLRDRFEPVDRRVTLPPADSVAVPDRTVLAAALKRLRVRAGLDACLFVSGHPAHVDAARERSIPLLTAGKRFKSRAGFDTWLQAPAAIAAAIDSRSADNLRTALALQLDVDYDFDLTMLERRGSRLLATGKRWLSVKAAGGRDPLLVPFPSSADFALSPRGAIQTLRFADDAARQMAAVESTVRSLIAHDQLAIGSGAIATRATHAIVRDRQGRRRLVRTRVRSV